MLDTLKVFCMEISEVETDSAFTFPSVWVSCAAHLESSWHANGDVFVFVLAKVTALAYF